MKNEIDKQIEILKKELVIFQAAAKRAGIADEKIEKQVNFYLENIFELLKMKETLKN